MNATRKFNLHVHGFGKESLCANALCCAGYDVKVECIHNDQQLLLWSANNFLDLVCAPQKFSDEITAKVAEADGRGLVKEGQDREVRKYAYFTVSM